MKKLEALGADTPDALLAQINASPEAFVGYLGIEHAQEIVRRLEVMVPKRNAVNDPPLPPGHFGVPLTSPGSLRSPAFDLQYRDQLFERIQALKKHKASRRQIQRLEKQLDELLDKHPD